MVITNELTTHVTPEETSIIPALGESHLHRVNTQITFGRDVDRPNLFVANITKSFTKCETDVPFRVSQIHNCVKFCFGIACCSKTNWLLIEYSTDFIQWISTILVNGISTCDVWWSLSKKLYLQYSLWLTKSYKEKVIEFI